MKRKKKTAAEKLIDRLEVIFPGLDRALDYQEVGTPRTHRRFLGRQDGTYGPIPQRKLAGLLGMPFNRTAISGLYCVGDSTFPGQGLNAVAFFRICLWPSDCGQYRDLIVCLEIRYLPI